MQRTSLILQLRSLAQTFMNFTGLLRFVAFSLKPNPAAPICNPTGLTPKKVQSQTPVFMISSARLRSFGAFSSEPNHPCLQELPTKVLGSVVLGSFRRSPTIPASRG